MSLKNLLHLSVLLVAIALPICGAHADDNIVVREYYCSSDGTFRVGVQELGTSGPGYDSHTCTHLTSTTASTHRLGLRQDRFAKPPGNALNLMLDTLFGQDMAKTEDFPLAEPHEYIVKVGLCETHPIFVVIETWREYFPNFGGQPDDFVCLFERSSAVRIQSKVDISGVYSREPGISAGNFATSIAR